MKKQTAANNEVLKSVKPLVNAPIYKEVLNIMNSTEDQIEAKRQAVEFLKQYSEDAFGLVEEVEQFQMERVVVEASGEVETTEEAMEKIEENFAYQDSSTVYFLAHGNKAGFEKFKQKLPVGAYCEYFERENRIQGSFIVARNANDEVREKQLPLLQQFLRVVLDEPEPREKFQADSSLKADGIVKVSESEVYKIEVFVPYARTFIVRKHDLRPGDVPSTVHLLEYNVEMEFEGPLKLEGFGEASGASQTHLLIWEAVDNVAKTHFIQ